jgi:hypothetical protein
VLELGRSREFGQTFLGYTGRGCQLVGYGHTGIGLVASGILRRERVGLATAVTLAVPAIGLPELRRVEAEWAWFVAAASAAIRDVQAVLAEAVLAAETADGERPSGDVAAADVQDAVYFVLADLVYEQLLRAGALPAPAAAAQALPRGMMLRAMVVERPRDVFEWIRGHSVEGT